MIEQGLFKRHFLGRDGFQWWIGQIAPAETWSENIPGQRVPSNNASEYKGFGERYKVRIMGYHTARKSDIPDDELPWATVMYPVTAGSGGGGASQTSNITRGTFVFGFFLDGEDAQQPVIMGCIGYNDYQEVMKNVPEAGFVPFSGFDPTEIIPAGALRQSGGGRVLGQSGSEGSTTGGTPNNNVVIESSQLGTTLQDKVTVDAASENVEPLAQPTSCEPLPVGALQQQIRNLIQDVEKLRKNLYRIQDGVNGSIADIEREINRKLDQAAKFIASGIKWIYTQVEQFVLGNVTEALKTVYNVAFPNERNNVKQTSNNILESISCFFRKLIGNLFDLVLNFLKDSIDRVVNVAECFVENFVSKILGTLSGVISGLFSGLEGLISGAVDLAGEGLGLAGDALGFVDDIFSFLTCDDRPECSDVNEWSIIGGPGKLTKGDVDSLINRAKGFAEDATSIGTDALDNFDGLFDINFSEIFDFSECDVKAILCGPPTVDFVGGGGSGAAGNLVIGALGEVLSVDMSSFGVGYDETTIATVTDLCGKGSGAVLVPVFGNVTVPTSGAGGVSPGSPGIPGAPIGFGPFSPSPYPFPSGVGPALSPQPFSPDIVGKTSPGGGGPVDIPTNVDLEPCIDVEFTVRREAALVNVFYFQATQRPKTGTGVVNFSFNGNDAPGTFTECIIPNLEYIVSAYLPTGGPVINPLKIFDNGSTVALDDSFDGGKKTVLVDVEVDNIIYTDFKITTAADYSNRIIIRGLDIDYQKINSGKLNEDQQREAQLDEDIERPVRANQVYEVEIISPESRAKDGGTRVRTRKNGARLECEEQLDSDWSDVRITASRGRFFDLIDNNGSANRATAKFIIEDDDKVTVQEEQLVDVGPVSDFDYDDLVVTAGKGRFYNVRGNICSFILEDVPSEPTPGTGGPVPSPPPGFPAIPGVLIPPSPGVDGDKGIVDVVVLDPGAGYLPAPDGSSGGDGRTWADPGDTIIERKDGRLEVPVPPDNVFCVLPGDIVTLPPGTNVITDTNDNQGGGELIIGGSPYTVQKPGCFSTPDPVKIDPPADTYPIILYLCEIIIINPGFGYKKGDEVVIEPSMGAAAEAKFDRFGRVIEVKVISSGEGFQVMPKVYIRSETGYNAELVPKLCIDRINEVREADQEKIITVIDCVGKFNG